MCPPCFFCAVIEPEQKEGAHAGAPLQEKRKYYSAKIRSICSLVRLMSVGSHGIISAVHGPS